VKNLLAAVAAVVAAALAVDAAGLTEAGRLSAVHDLIIQARFDRARSALKDACPPAPREACLALEALAVWWQIQQDPDSKTLDGEIERAAQTAIAAAEQWTVREPSRAEAWFYLAGAYAPLTEWNVLRGERLRAARNGLKIKDALERTLMLDPSLKDAYFGIGLYHYYAAVAPASVRMLRWLLLLPGGDRDQGLREMLQARREGVLLRGEADYQLHWLYLWYEHQPDQALALLRDLDARYPGNALFLQRIAEVHRDYRHDRQATIAAWQTLLDRARTKSVESAPLAEVRARLGLAEALTEPSEAARVMTLLAPVVDAAPSAPYGSLARAHFELGRAYDRLGDRVRAIASLTNAIETAPHDDATHIRSRARDELGRIRAQRR
jgi:tetratricopeptide (TPR) repeat protein